MIAIVPTAKHTAEFDLFGFVGIRVVADRAEDCALVAGMLGPIRKPLTRAPDITVRFVDRLETSGPLSLVGRHDCGFSADQFYVTRGKNKSVIRVQVPFEEIGGPCEIVCESGLKNLPLLIEIINLTALQRDALPLHASAFEYNGHGILCAGWAQGGKTETLLGFMANGARYIGDEWVYLQKDVMQGIPEPMHIWDWHVDELPLFRRKLNWQDRFRMRSLRIAAGAMDAAISTKPMNRLLPRKTTRRLIALLNRQRYIEVLPDRIFETAITDPSGQLDHLLFVLSHDSPEYRVEQADTNEVLNALAPALEQERSHLLERYRMFRFAFPGRKNNVLEDAANRERELLKARLGHLPAHIIYHPYPMSPTRLFETIAPLFPKS